MNQHRSGLPILPLFLWMIWLTQPHFAVSQDTSVSDEPVAEANSAAGELREWKDQSGQFSTRASLQRFDDENVMLAKEDGSVVSVPLVRLSAEDREYMQGLRDKEVGTHGVVNAGSEPVSSSDDKQESTRPAPDPAAPNTSQLSSEELLLYGGGTVIAIILAILVLAVLPGRVRRPKTTKICPVRGCGASIPIAAEVCMDCGCNVDTGERVASQRFVDVAGPLRSQVRYTVKNSQLEVQRLSRGQRSGRRTSIDLTRFNEMQIEEGEGTSEYYLRTLKVWGIVACTAGLALPVFFFLFPGMTGPRRPNQITFLTKHDGKVAGVEFVEFQNTDSMNEVVSLIERFTDL